MRGKRALCAENFRKMHGKSRTLRRRKQLLGHRKRRRTRRKVSAAGIERSAKALKDKRILILAVA
jgi:hypothetical protein